MFWRPLLLIVAHGLQSPPAELHRAVLPTPDGPLSYVTVGTRPSDAQGTILMVHGSPGDALAFKTLLNDSALQRSGAWLVSVDRPGYGGSTPRKATPLAAQSQRIGHLLGTLPQPVVVMGHSYGGPLVLQLALDFPQQVQGIVVVAGSVDPSLERTMWYQKVAQWALMRALLPTDLVVCNDEILALQQELPVLQTQLARLTQPTLVLQGGKDGLVPPGNADFLERELVQAPRTVVRFPALDHFIPFSQPELVRDALLQQLQRLAQVQPASTVK